MTSPPDDPAVLELGPVDDVVPEVPVPSVVVVPVVSPVEVVVPVASVTPLSVDETDDPFALTVPLPLPFAEVVDGGGGGGGATPAPMAEVPPPVVVGVQSVFTHASASEQLKSIQPMSSPHAQPENSPVEVLIETPPLCGAKLTQPIFSPHAQPTSVPLPAGTIVTPVDAQAGIVGAGLAGFKRIHPQFSDQISPVTPESLTETEVPCVVFQLTRL